MLLVDNTLTSLETGKAREAGYSYYTAQGKTLRDKLNIPIEAEVIYTKNPNWDPSMKDRSGNEITSFLVFRGIKKDKS